MIPIYTRYLTPSDYGLLALLGVVGSILSSTIRMGLGSALFRSYYDYDDEEKRRMVVSTTFFCILLISVVSAGILLPFSKQLAAIILKGDKYAKFIFLVVLNTCIGSLNGISFAVFRAKKESKKYAAISVLSFILGATLNIYFVVVLKQGVWGIIVAGFISGVISTIVLYSFIWRELKFIFNLEETNKLLSFGIPLVPTDLAAWVLTMADRFFLDHYSTRAEVGLYSLGYKFGSLIHILIVNPFSLISPVMIYSEEKSKDAPEFYAKLTTYFIFVGLFMSLGISALAQDVLRLMAAKPFWSAYTVAPLICLSYVVYGSRGLLSVGIGLKRKTKYFPPMYLGAAGVNIVLNFLFIPKYGMMGAAVATLLSYLSMIPIRYYVGRKFFRVDYEWMRIVKMIIVAILLYAISILVFFQTIWLSILVRGLIAVSFPFVLFVIGFYQDAEKRKIKEIVGNLIGYLRRKKEL